MSSWVCRWRPKLHQLAKRGAADRGISLNGFVARAVVAELQRMYGKGEVPDSVITRCLTRPLPFPIDDEPVDTDQRELFPEVQE